MPKQKIRLLMREHQHKEWMGYMVGGIDGPDVMVEDLVIPPHEDSTYASAEAEPFHIPDRCVGVIHSHHTMGAFHSTTDAEHVDANFPVSITVARKDNNLEFDTVVNMETECGRMANVEGKIKFVEPPPTFDEEAWVEEANTNIKKGQNKPITPVGSRVTQHYPQYPSGTYGGYLGHYWDDEVEKKDNGWGKNGKETTNTVKKGEVYVPVRFRMNSGDIFDTTKGRALTPEEVAAELRQQEIEETMTRFAGWTP